MTRIFILEDDPARVRLFLDAVGPRGDVNLATNVANAQRIWTPTYDLVLLDHDLGGEVYVDSTSENTGAGFARWLVSTRAEPTTALIHSYNPDGARAINNILREGGWVNVARMPFGPSILKYLRELTA